MRSQCALRLRMSFNNCRSIRQHYREKRGVRTATKTLVLVVGCYLLSNLVSILLGFWDHLAPRDVERNYYGFLIVSDLASLVSLSPASSSVNKPHFDHNQRAERDPTYHQLFHNSKFHYPVRFSAYGLWMFNAFAYLLHLGCSHSKSCWKGCASMSSSNNFYSGNSNLALHTSRRKVFAAS